jgi:hypothetical protein
MLLARCAVLVSVLTGAWAVSLDAQTTPSTTKGTSSASQRVTSVFVDYYVAYKGGSRSRTQATLSIAQQLNGAQSETAVLAYLRKKHREASDITIMRLEWKTTSGASVSPTRKATSFSVDYYVTYKGGNRGRFQMTTGITQIDGAQSETAVLAYLKKRHSEARDITIMKLEWK